MSVVEGGVIRQLSVSQVERFDHKQKGGCERAWWFERVEDMTQESSRAKDQGDAGHAGFAHYFIHGKLPDGRFPMKKAVNGAILKGKLPKPGPDLLVEWRFDGQRKFDTNTCACGHPLTEHENDACKKCKCVDPREKWLPLKRESTLWLGGIPWEGFIDLALRRTEHPTVIDHKFSVDIHEYAKAGRDLIKTVQMPVYVLALLRRPEFAGADLWRLVHHYVSRKGVDSFFRSDVVTLDQVREREADIVQVVERMKAVAPLAKQDDVPFNRKSCSAWMGCPHQSICSAFKENKVQFSPDELAMFGELSDQPTAPAAAAPAPASQAEPPEPDEDDPFADLEDDTPAPAPAAKAEAPKPEAGTSLVPTAQAPSVAAQPESPKRGFEIMPACQGCGVDLNPDNASKLRDGRWVHIGCPQMQEGTPPAAPAEKPVEKPAAKPPAKPKKPKEEKSGNVGKDAGPSAGGQEGAGAAQTGGQPVADTAANAGGAVAGGRGGGQESPPERAPAGPALTPPAAAISAPPVQISDSIRSLSIPETITVRVELDLGPRMVAFLQKLNKLG